MKKYIIGAVLALAIAIPAYTHADSTQTLLDLWKVVSGYITPRNASNGLQIPALASSNLCLKTDATGKVATTTCGSGGTGSTTTINTLLGPDFTFSTSSIPGLNFLITGSGSTLTFSPAYATGYSIPLNASSTEWSAKATASGTPTQVAFFDGQASLSSDSNLYWDNTNKNLGVGGTPGTAKLYVNGNVGIGTTSPSQLLEVNGNAKLSLPANHLYLGSEMDLTGNQINLQSGAVNSVISFNYSGKSNAAFNFYDGSGVGGGLKAVINPNGNSYLNGGNVGIGTTTPSFKLTVTGTSYISGSTTIASLTAGPVYSTASGGLYTGSAGAGTVTSVDMTVPTGLSVSGNPVTTSGTLALSLTSGYNIPLTASTTNWNTAYGWGNHASAGYLTASALTPYLTTTTAASTYQPIGSYLTAAVTSLNGLTGGTQTFATSTGGSLWTITSSGTAHTWNIPATPTFTGINLTNASTTNISVSGVIYDKNNNQVLGGIPTRFANVASTTISSYSNKSFGTASTTFQLSPLPYASTMKYMYCKTKTGSVNISWGNGTTYSNFVATTSGASTTPAIVFTPELSQLLTASSTTAGSDGLMCTAMSYPN